MSGTFAAALLNREDVCSTPFGITASGTHLEGPLARLLGITASGTQEAWEGLLADTVLNAFRHHGERDAAAK